VSERTDFLYPFLEHGERDTASLLADLTRSARAKGAASQALRAEALVQTTPARAAAATAMAARFRAGGRLFTFCNGGSATDAAAIAALFERPPEGRSLPARSLVEDTAVLTALGNDVGFDLVFRRQLIAYATARDIALGVSTSGNSTNVMAAFAEAHHTGLLTIGLAGYDGGEMSRSNDVDHVLVVSADSVHRIQETQAALSCALWAAVQAALAEPANASAGHG
jgi:D-sedoheptulose 7-phosphate isomerase